MSDFKQYLVVIDPGHGGNDYGASGDISLEKELNLKYARALRDRMMLDTRFMPVLTRHNDSYIHLSTRSKIAIDKKADIFISIHMNSFTSDQPNGTQIYYYDDIKDIKLANTLIGYINKKHNKTPSKWTGVRFGNYQVLRDLSQKTKIPAVLLEVGFISNEDEEVRLNDNMFRSGFVDGLFNGILHYLTK